MSKPKSNVVLELLKSTAKQGYNYCKVPMFTCDAAVQELKDKGFVVEQGGLSWKVSY